MGVPSRYIMAIRLALGRERPCLQRCRRILELGDSENRSIYLAIRKI